MITVQLFENYEAEELVYREFNQVATLECIGHSPILTHRVLKLQQWTGLPMTSSTVSPKNRPLGVFP